jgi:glucose-1-phosphate thymidylyltransferase
VAALIATHHRTGADATLNLMAASRSQVARSSAVVASEGWVRKIVEKPIPEQAPSSTISLPLYVCSPALLPLLGEIKRSVRGEYEMADAFQMLIDRGGRVAQHTADWRLQVSSTEDLLALNLHLLKGRTGQTGEPVALGRCTRLIPPLVIGPGVEIASDCRIGPNVYLEGPCRIETGVHIRDAVVLRDAAVAPGRQLRQTMVW